MASIGSGNAPCLLQQRFHVEALRGGDFPVIQQAVEAILVGVANGLQEPQIERLQTNDENVLSARVACHR
jgi:hypothetical protein